MTTVAARHFPPTHRTDGAAKRCKNIYQEHKRSIAIPRKITLLHFADGNAIGTKPALSQSGYSVIRILILTFLLLPTSQPLAADHSEIDPALATWTLKTVNGEHYRFPDDARGKVTIVLIWASWCPYCKALMPHLQSMLAEYGSDDMQVLALQAWDDKDPLLIINDSAFDFVVFGHATNIAEQCYGAHGTPGVLLYDRDGVLRYNQATDFRIPDAVLEQQERLSHRQRAARRVPRWAARLRSEIDDIL